MQVHLDVLITTPSGVPPPDMLHIFLDSDWSDEWCRASSPGLFRVRTTVQPLVPSSMQPHTRVTKLCSLVKLYFFTQQPHKLEFRYSRSPKIWLV